MANDATASQDLADKFKTEKDSPYLRFVRGEGLDIISAQYVPNLRTVELKPWPRKGGKGVFINHEASRTRTTVMSARSRRERRSSRNATCSRR
jgi:hypothetical protein